MATDVGQGAQGGQQHKTHTAPWQLPAAAPTTRHNMSTKYEVRYAEGWHWGRGANMEGWWWYVGEMAKKKKKKEWETVG